MSLKPGLEAGLWLHGSMFARADFLFRSSQQRLNPRPLLSLNPFKQVEFRTKTRNRHFKAAA